MNDANTVRRDSAKWARRLGATALAIALGASPARHGGVAGAVSDDAFANALRIARKMHNDDLVVSLLARRALRPNASNSEIKEALEAYEGMARPDAAAAFLAKRVQSDRRDRQALVLLAELLARSDRGDEAIARYEDAKERFGLTSAETSAFVHVLARRGKLDRALEVLKEATAEGTLPLSPAVVRDLGALGWELDDIETAYGAYSQLDSLGETSRDELGRLVSLAEDTGRPAEAMRWAKARYERDGQVDDLLYLGELQQKHGDWEGLSRTLERAAARGRSATDRPSYWQLEIAADVHAGKVVAVRDAYEGLLALDPDSTFARAGLLWNAVDRADRGALSRYTSAFFEGATKDKELWAPMAAALAFLDRPQESLRFSALQLEDAPGDDMALLAFADTLERTGDATRAMRLRQAALLGLRPRIEAALGGDAPLDEKDARLLLAQAQYARDTGGPDAAERWFQALLARAPEAAHELTADAGAGSAVSEDTLFDLLDRGRDEQASVLIAQAMTDSRDAGGEDSDIARGPLGELAYRRGAMVSASAGYARLGVLETAQVGVSASHRAFGMRVEYVATGRSFSGRGSEVALPEPRREGDFLARGRFQKASTWAELGAGLNVQEHSAIPRASLSWEERWSTVVTSVVGAEGNAIVADETAALRIFGLRDHVRLNAFGELAPFYFGADVDGFEDHTRDYDHAGWGMRQELELGLRLVRDRPAVSLGVTGAALERRNPRALPHGLLTLQPALEDALPRSYTAVSLVAHVGHGDWLDRYHRDYRDFPRFACDGAIGVLVSTRALIGLASCAVNVKVTRSSFATVEGRYALGVAGVARLANASAFVSLGQAF